MNINLNPNHWETVLEKTKANLEAIKQYDDYEAEQDSYKILEQFYTEKIARIEKRLELLTA